MELRQPDSRYPDLTADQPYVVIGIEANDYRILNDLGRPFLYPPDLFEVIDPREPAEWVQEVGEDDERYAYPPPLQETGFFEDFFDAKQEAVTTFWRIVNRQLATAATAA
ncbi:MAG TPA: hypothetical protein VF017_20195 [Thermoanaerobaculia bacterium]|nr:hypothetical protein [Thermoanaerobaculia bacterium]